MLAKVVRSNILPDAARDKEVAMELYKEVPMEVDKADMMQD